MKCKGIFHVWPRFLVYGGEVALEIMCVCVRACSDSIQVRTPDGFIVIVH